MAGGQPASFDVPGAVDENVERPLGRGFGIQLAQTAGRGIARIDEGFLAGIARPLIKSLESGPRHEYLAADLEPGRVTLPPQYQRD